MAYDLFGPVFPLYDYQTAHARSPTWWRQIEMMILSSSTHPTLIMPLGHEITWRLANIYFKVKFKFSACCATTRSLRKHQIASLGWANQLIYNSGSLLYFISLRRNVARPSPNLTSYGQLEQEAAEALWWPMLRRFHRRIKACLIMRCVSIFL